MESKADNKSCLRAALLFLIVLLFIPAFRFCAGQIYYQRAQVLVRQQVYDQAASLLQRAAQWLPWDSAIQLSLGETYLTLARRTEGLIQETYCSIAVEHLQTAAQLNPLEPEIAVMLAYALEADGQNNSPEVILTAYRRAAVLAPNMGQYVELLADKLWLFKQQEEIPAVAKTLGRIAPSSYYKLRSKSWWGPQEEEHFRQGLLQAVAQGGMITNNYLRQARTSLAYIMAARQDWIAAAEQQRLALVIEEKRNSRKEYFQLAAYYLHSKNLPAASEAVLIGAEKEASAAAILQGIVAHFHNSGQQAALPDFYRILRSKCSFSYLEDLQLAELLIQRKQDDFALKLLFSVIAERDYLPKPWLLLADIYRRQKKPADMEAALAKARLRTEKSTAPVRLPLPRPSHQP